MTYQGILFIDLITPCLLRKKAGIKILDTHDPLSKINAAQPVSS
jgi:hypothetical protein